MALWILQAHFPNSVIRFGSMYADNLAMARATPRVNAHLATVVAGLMSYALDSKSVGSIHVKAHSGDPWNELADVICNGTSESDVGFVPPYMPEGLHRIIRDDPKACDCFSLVALPPSTMVQYPPCDQSGQMDLLANLQCGWTALDTGIVCGHVDGSLVSSPSVAPAFVPFGNGLHALSIYVQRLRDPKVKRSTSES